MWDCLVNGWEAGWGGGWLQRALSPAAQVLDRTRQLVLPPAAYSCEPAELRSITIEQFPEDSSTIPKAEQLLRSLPHLSRPVAFEILGMGPLVQYDYKLLSQLLMAGEDDRRDEAILGWSAPYTLSRFVAHEQDMPRLHRLLLAHYPNSAVIVGEKPDRYDDHLPASDLRNGDGHAASLALEGAYCLPLKAYGRLDPDPLGVAIAAMDDLDRDEWAILQVQLERAEMPWETTLRESLENPYHDEFLLAEIAPRDLAQKFCGPLYAVAVHIAASRTDVFRQLLGWAEQFTTQQQRLVCNRSQWTGDAISDDELHCFARSLETRAAHRPGMLLSAVELSSLVHLPSQAVVSPRLKAVKRRTQPVDEAPAQAGSVLIGVNVGHPRYEYSRRRLA